MPVTPHSGGLTFGTLDAAIPEQCAAILSKIESKMHYRLPRLQKVILPLVAATGDCQMPLPKAAWEIFIPIGGSDVKLPMKKTQIPGRVAIRHEGHMVNAYWARPDTMEGAFWLGSIPAYFTSGGDIFERWKKLMIDGAGMVIEDITGGKIETWTEKTAPAHEKTKE